MLKNKKERLYIKDILPEPAVESPLFYLLSSYLSKNEMMQQVLIDIHSYDFKHYKTPKDFDDIFCSLSGGAFVVFKEKYAVGNFSSKLMYLESGGWRAMPCMIDTFRLDNWLIP